ncbi:hypothetical protein SAICODRAFT_17748 [Saitoella complicata NRRL Y-17804]|uniref:Exonuclease V n=1 Tax=Saitoella complicata (strain BCRC 22490 / CBS 7301 / JCM 7358 / NBRC 10748 / NRRL Y-17804) TaxID=698492 RepID=A0A0E9NRC8_SAICN|nr:uncharacterized protein SAICODRAFT_17748 [Saitoella complicata NRRL Y-17804]ODQ54756.1 hypothetical protein SAICODRAFT_17748 [Saitoella complicata NRRL Y-17804]GAO51970.1 hypothetical protein G7K_6058-t1 [Saitoella complicata NRRL Y-17804]
MDRDPESDYGDIEEFDRDYEALVTGLTQADAVTPTISGDEGEDGGTGTPDIVQTGVQVGDGEGVDEAERDAVSARGRESETYADNKRSATETEALNSAVLEPSASPYDRFRARKKGLSVTDLSGSEWCEVQLVYKLETELETGKRPRTEAMKKGEEIHKMVEEEIQNSVEFEIDTEVDKWGLKLLNLLRVVDQLECEGIAREVAVFGFQKDTFFSGIIDELQCKEPVVAYTLENRQQSISSFLELPGVPRHDKIITISDLKTRVSSRMPSQSQSKGYRHQLGVYRRLFIDLVEGWLDFERFLQHQGLDGDEVFSDLFIAQAISLDPIDSNFEPILEHNTLRTLYALLSSKLQKFKGCIGTEMTISYRRQTDAGLIGEQVFEYDDADIEAHLTTALGFWKGTRKPTGVKVYEAYKCRHCEFEEVCEWRKTKAKEAAERNRIRMTAGLDPSRDMDFGPVEQ